MSSIRATTSSISSIIQYIISESENNSEHIKQFLKESDLYFTVTTIQAFISEQNISDSHKSISNALAGVSDILSSINDDLQSIKNEFDAHKKKLFNSYRTFAWSKNISTLECHDNILKHRYNLLFELLKIYKFNNPHKINDTNLLTQ